jgi:hypothetical protein
MKHPAALVLCLLALAAAPAWWLLRPEPPADPPARPAGWFEDVTDAVGLDFVHDAGPLDDFFTPQIHGSGVAVLDFDGDGRLDLYFLTNGGPESKSTNRLYRNMPDGKFKDVTAGSGLGIAGYNMGVAVGDVDNDGRPDVVVTQYGGVKLFLNRGDGKFDDVTAAAGLANPAWGASAAFLDYDRDGKLDLIVVNYFDYDPSWVCHAPSGEREYCGPNNFKGNVARLFHNLGRASADPGAAVRFEDVTVAAGLAKAPGPGLGVVCADFDGDGWQDVFIANDGKPNHLWRNRKDGTFAEEAFLCGLAVDALGQAQAGMGIAIGDADGDGLFDLYVTHLTSERNTLWQQGPARGQFRDRTAPAGLLKSEWRGTGFGTLLADFDLDGWPDLAVVNGRVNAGTSTPNPGLGRPERFAERNQLFRNLGGGKFADVSAANPALCGTPNVARGLAAGDLDGDGAPDLVVTTVGGRARVFRNVARPRGHWLAVRPFDPALKRDAYGAEITVRAGERRWVRVVGPSESYFCSSDPRAHFGLGDAGRVDELLITWPDGTRERFDGVDADRVVEIRKGAGQPAP